MWTNLIQIVDICQWVNVKYPEVLYPVMVLPRFKHSVQQLANPLRVPVPVGDLPQGNQYGVVVGGSCS